MSITREELLEMSMNPRDLVSYHVDMIVRAVESCAEKGDKFYADGGFPHDMSEVFYDVVYELTRIFIDSEVYVTHNARTGELSLTIDWSSPRKD